jgi:chromosomal replication initiator protein
MWGIPKHPANDRLFPDQNPELAVIECSGGRCYARPSFRSTKERAGGVEKPIELTAEGVWNEISGRLREALNENTFSTWFAEVNAAEITDAEFVLTVPNDFTREWIEGHFLDLISAALAEVAGERSVRLRIAEHAAKPEAAEPKVSEQTAQPGPTGLGKTHLLQAVSQYVGEHPGNLSVRYVTSETFMNDFINSLRDKRIEGFKQRYRTYDLLLVDDVQFFEHKERIQEEFFHTFNSLYESGSQIVMSSDRPPRDIATLEERLRSRFEWGLITDIQPPDLETRIAILRKRVKTDNINVPDPQVLTFIAGRVSTNIRELEGALTRVVAFCSLTGRPMNEELAQDVLKDVFPQGDLPQVTIERIQEIISDRFGLSLDELCGDRRSQNIVYPRQVAMYLSRELTDSSLPKIGKQFGGRDHTTVIHATSKIARMIREDRSVYNLVQELTARIKQVR